MERLVRRLIRLCLCLCTACLGGRWTLNGLGFPLTYCCVVCVVLPQAFTLRGLEEDLGTCDAASTPTPYDGAVRALRETMD